MSHASTKKTPTPAAAPSAQEPAQERQATPATAQHPPRALVRPQTPAPDEHAGQGGLYTRQGGARQLVERTGLAAPAPVSTDVKE